MDSSQQLDRETDQSSSAQLLIRSTAAGNAAVEHNLLVQDANSVSSLMILTGDKYPSQNL